MASKRKELITPRRGAAPRKAASTSPAAAVSEAQGPDTPIEAQDDDLRPLRRSGSGGFSPAIAGIMHGIDADIFRDPASIQRMQRDSAGVVRTADGTVIGIGLPGVGVITEPEPAEAPPRPKAPRLARRSPGLRERLRRAKRLRPSAALRAVAG